MICKHSYPSSLIANPRLFPLFPACFCLFCLFCLFYLFLLVFVVHTTAIFAYDRVSPTRKHIVAFNEAMEFSRARIADLEVVDLWYKQYEFVAKEKKRLAVIWENKRVRMGYGPKVKGGRTHKSGNNEAILFMRKMLKENGVNPVMDLVSDEDKEVCYRVLEADSDAIGEHADEAHLYAEAERASIDGIAKKLKNITLNILDATSAPCLRPQDILGCKARDFHILMGLLRAILPADCKNGEELARGEYGLAVNHTKSSDCKGERVCVLVCLFSWHFGVL